MGQHGQDHSGQTRDAGPCCVLWTPAGRDIPAELLASLERRGLAWVPARDGYSAMAEVLLRQRAIGATGKGAKAAVLVLVYPTLLDLSGLVVDALGRFAGPVAVWRYDPDAHPVLAAAQRHELATVFVRTESVEPRPNRKPEHLTSAHVEDDADEPTASSLLSEEELSMLLADRHDR